MGDIRIRVTTPLETFRISPGAPATLTLVAEQNGLQEQHGLKSIYMRGAEKHR